MKVVIKRKIGRVPKKPGMTEDEERERTVHQTLEHTAEMEAWRIMDDIPVNESEWKWKFKKRK